MKKEEIQSQAKELGIKFQENDTIENLNLMIAGKLTPEQLIEAQKEIIGLNLIRLLVMLSFIELN